MYNQNSDIDVSTIKLNKNKLESYNCKSKFKSRNIVTVTLLLLSIIILLSTAASKINNVSKLDGEIYKILRQRQRTLGRQKYLNEQIKVKVADLKEKNLNKTDTEKMLSKISGELSESQSRYNKIERDFDVLFRKLKSAEAEFNELKLQDEFYSAHVYDLGKEVALLKKEYESLVSDPKKANDSLVLDSQILTKSLKLSLESKLHGKIIKICYDGPQFRFHQKELYDRCFHNPMLIILTTDNNEHIAAYADVEDTNENNFISNLDRRKTWRSELKVRIFGSDEEKLLYFGNDLVIKSDGSGYSDFPQCFGDRGKDRIEDFLMNIRFLVYGLEVFTVQKIYGNGNT